jgi:hypothetical protein
LEGNSSGRFNNARNSIEKWGFDLVQISTSRLLSGRNLALAVLAVALVTLGLAAQASAERPGWYSNPGLSGPAQVGGTLVGHMGGIVCTPNCQGTAWEVNSCTGPGSAGADRPTGGLPFDGQSAPGCVTRVPFPGTGPDPVYVVRPEDAGRHIQVHMVATNIDCGEINHSDGSQECRSSTGHAYTNTVGPITGSVAPVAPALPPAVLPLNTAPPTILGTPEEKQTLTANNGTWTGTDPIAYTHQWLRCSTALKGCQAIQGATKPTYILVAEDVGTRITVTVSATNRGGGRAFTAKLTGRVFPATPRPGYLALSAKDLRAEHQLVISAVRGPTAVRSGGSATFIVRVADKRGFLVKGAEVEVAEATGKVSAANLSRPTGNAIVRIKFGRLAKGSKVTVAITATDPDGEAKAGTKRLTLTVQA